ncbi:MAG TPA: TonB-dependent receptor plug domain-containing protein [Gemmatimonadales bacterium]|nr:TonB-dependent receptor plug domain-containing protein [Gemmatimonadales bacterium]
MALPRVVTLPTMLLVVASCARSPGPAPRSASPASSVPPEIGTLITQDQIAASGARTAWDALRLTVPHIQLRESRGSAARIQRRGRSSIYLDDQVRVIVDNVRVPDLQLLEQMAAADIFQIQVLNAMDAATYFGGASASGVVIITTRAK